MGIAVVCTKCKNKYECLWAKYNFSHCPMCGATNIIKETEVAQHKKSKTKKSGNGSKIKVTKKTNGSKKAPKR